MTEVIKFTSLGYGDLRLAKQFCSKPILENLFQTEGGIIVVDQNGEEMFPDEKNNEYSLNPKNTYTVVSEKDLESDSENDNEDDLENEHIHNHQHQEEEEEEEAEEEVEEKDNHNHNHEHNHSCCAHEHSHSHEHIDEKEHNHDHDDHDDHGLIQNHGDIDGFNKLLKMREYRIKMINENYTRLHPDIFKLKEEFFEKDFFNAVKEYKESDKSKPEILLKPLKKLTETDIYSFRIFNMDFCKKLVEEIDNFKASGLPTARANSMNNYGLVLDEIGFTEFFEDLRKNYLIYYTGLLYPKHNGDKIDSHHAFIVQYEMEKEKDLGFHYDESNVTLNLCLGKEFTGGSLYFKGILNEPETHNELVEIQHSVGTALLHIGIHRHGANSISSGERTNLILWLRYTGGINN